MRAIHLFYFSVFFITWPSFALINITQMGFGLQISQLITICIAGLAAISVLSKELIPKNILNKSSLLLLLFLMYSMLSIILSAKISVNEFFGERAWLRSIKQVMNLLLSSCFFFLPQLVLKTAKQLKFSVDLYIYSVLFSCFWGGYQLISFYINIPYFDGLHNNISTPQGYEQIYNGTKRVSALSGEPAMFGLQLITALGLLAPFVLKVRKKLKYFPVLVASVIVLMCLLTTSFAAIFGLLLVAVFVFWDELKRNKKSVIKLSLFALFVVPITYPFVEQFFISRLLASLAGESYSSLIRAQMAVISFDIFLENILFGVGIGNFGFFAPEVYANSTFTLMPLVFDKYWEPMGILPRLIAEFGLVGTSIFGCFVYSLLKDCMKTNEVGVALKISFMCTFLVMLVAIPSFSWLNLWFVAGVIQANRNMVNANAA